MEGVVRIDALCKHELNHLLLRGAQLFIQDAAGSPDQLMDFCAILKICLGQPLSQPFNSFLDRRVFILA